jgi:cell division protein ZapE
LPHRLPIDHRYDALVTAGAIERDPAQEILILRLKALSAALVEKQMASKSSPLGWLFGRKANASGATKGLYIWGAVGRGKTMLMDLFFESCPINAKRRVHFHAFMADVHERIHAHRQRVKSGEISDSDPIPSVALALAADASLLCFDEFMVSDIADAMILGRLFTALFAQQVTVVATSNVDPARLYEGGLNRALFLPFIALLQTQVEVVQLAARTDFRLEKLGGAPTYHTPADDRARAALDLAFARLGEGVPGQPLVLDVKGHALRLPQVAGGVARASFQDLCAQAYGASDYIVLARRFHTLVLDDVPVLDFERRNEAKRFIILIDTLYEHQVKLVISAMAAPDKLYLASSGREAFEFDRTVSRLIEMRSTQYLSQPHGRPGAHASGQTTGLVET